MITENGVVTDDDKKREEFIQRALIYYLLSCLEKGIDNWIIYGIP